MSILTAGVNPDLEAVPALNLTLVLALITGLFLLVVAWGAVGRQNSANKSQDGAVRQTANWFGATMIIVAALVIVISGAAFFLLNSVSGSFITGP